MCILINVAAITVFLKSQILLILYSYSLEQTEQFLNCVLEADPVKTVIAQESVHQNEIVSSYSAAKNREKKVFLFFLNSSYKHIQSYVNENTLPCILSFNIANSYRQKKVRKRMIL